MKRLDEPRPLCDDALPPRSLRPLLSCLEIGIDFGAVLDALGVHGGSWLGFAAHVAADDFRIPYTAGGVRWDANPDEWRGPDTGNSCGDR